MRARAIGYGVTIGAILALVLGVGVVYLNACALGVGLGLVLFTDRAANRRHTLGPAFEYKNERRP